jgi:hypothetical protein
MFKGIAKNSFGMILDLLLPPPSSEEKEFLSELKTAFREMAVLETINVLPSEAAWLRNMNNLREHVLNKDPRKFLQWDVVSRTMFTCLDRYLFTELNYLKDRSDWNTRWRAAIKESSVGCPIPYIFYPSSSGNLIHHAYHVAQFEEKTKIQVHNIDYVFEFGGGYGSMCRLFYNLGFHGTYIIFDLPSFSALQRYFLRTMGFQVQSGTEFLKSRNGIVCVSNLAKLIELLTDHIEARKAMFVATWSISESPTSLRNSVLPLTSEFLSFLIAYQDKFGEVNNVDYFDNWKETIKNVAWHSWRIEHIPGNNYLVGRMVAEL